MAIPGHGLVSASTPGILDSEQSGNVFAPGVDFRHGNNSASHPGH